MKEEVLYFEKTFQRMEKLVIGRSLYIAFWLN